MSCNGALQQFENMDICSECGVDVFAAILILYLITWLKFDDSTATSIFHSYIVLCYFSPVLGAIIADGYLGRYRSVLKGCEF